MSEIRKYGSAKSYPCGTQYIDRDKETLDFEIIGDEVVIRSGKRDVIYSWEVAMATPIIKIEKLQEIIAELRSRCGVPK